VNIKQTADYTLVRDFIRQPAQWQAATDDFAPDPETWQPNPDPRIIYLAAREGQRLFGVFTVIPHSTVCHEIHMAADISRFKTATHALRAAIAWMFAHTHAARIVASIPATNGLAIALARRAGLEQYGMNPRSFQKRGRLVDQILLGTSRTQ
jgi:RimJ/RimL family protein N-acetyltransferase